MQNFRRKCIEVDSSYRNSNILIENRINYSVLQIYLTNSRRFPKKFLLIKFLAARLLQKFKASKFYKESNSFSIGPYIALSDVEVFSELS